LVPVLFTFYIQGVLKLKKNNSGAIRLKRTRRETVRTKYGHVKDNDTHFVSGKFISIVLAFTVGSILN